MKSQRSGGKSGKTAKPDCVYFGAKMALFGGFWKCVATKSGDFYKFFEVFCENKTGNSVQNWFSNPGVFSWWIKMLSKVIRIIKRS